CAAYSQASQTIWHGPNFQGRVNNMSATQARAAFKHEIGHFLGLDHTSSPPTIMNQPPGTCATGFLYIPYVFRTDANKANSCMGLSSSPCAQPSPSPTPTMKDSCEETNWYWNFTNSTCQDTPWSCPYFTNCSSGDTWNPETCVCDPPPCPIILDVSGSGISLTDNAGGVRFDLNSNGHREKLSW